jgi:hypothetical protein
MEAEQKKYFIKSANNSTLIANVTDYVDLPSYVDKTILKKTKSESQSCKSANVFFISSSPNLQLV